MASTTSRAILRSRLKKAREQLAAGERGVAEQMIRSVCAADGADAEAWFLLGALHGQRGEMDEAITHARRAIAIRPDYADAWYNLAQAFMHVERFADAVEAYRGYLKLRPAHADAHNALGLALLSLGRHDQSLACFQEAIRLAPELADAWHNAGNACLAAGRNDEGIRHMRRAIELRPDCAKSHVRLGYALATIGAHDEALTSFQRATSLDPDQPNSKIGEAFVWERRGQFDKAWELLRPLYESGCREGRLILVFASLAKHLKMQVEAVAMLEDAIANGRLVSTELRHAHFALGTLYDGRHDYARAFSHFEHGNCLRQGADVQDRLLANMHRARRIFTRDFFSRMPRAIIASQRPIFIVGMPRSGTTLTEQILCSHPLVAGGGELSEMTHLSDWLDREFVLDESLPQRANARLGEFLDVGARRYLDRLSSISANAAYVTDKMPHNFIQLGVVALLFPEAHIVHCHRHPVDNCLSIYTFDFVSSHAYANDLSRLGEHYRGYRGLMQHWREHLPLPIFDLRYEDMILDQEATTRALLEFCGLPWDPGCLRFHDNQRVVTTFSYDQVRQPIYRKSVQRWKHYEHFLHPLINALGPDADLGPGMVSGHG